MSRIAIVASARGNGKTTLGRELADRLGVPFVELDALVHGPDWTETPDEVLRSQLLSIISRPGWVIDGAYERKLGSLVLDAAEIVIWLDLPIRVWLPRLIVRTWRRWRTQEELWNGNRESLVASVGGRDSLFAYAIWSHFHRRRTWPQTLRDYPTLRLRTTTDVANLLGRCTVLSTVTIIGLDHVQIAAPAGCEPAARHFFGELLGLSELAKPEPLRQRGGVWFALGDQQLHVGVDEPFAPAAKAHPALSVRPAQLEALAARLETAGAKVVWDDALTDVRRFYSEDPWGNRLEFVAAP